MIPSILVAASEGVPATPAQEEHQNHCDTWVAALSQRESKRLLRKLLAEDAAMVKAEMLAAIRESALSTDWPAVALDRAFGELLERSEVLRGEHDAKEQKKREAAARRKAAKQERERQARMNGLSRYLRISRQGNGAG